MQEIVVWDFALPPLNLAMRRRMNFLMMAFAAFNLHAAEDLPAPETGESLPIEPPLLTGNRAPDGSLVAPAETKKSVPVDLDLERWESVLIRAKRDAGSADRMFKAGIISKVDAEERGLKVIRLEAKIAAARLEKIKLELDSSAERDREALALAESAATRASDEQRRAELDHAARNLQRQQKLLALGSARKADVNRAEQKLAEVQRSSK